MALVLLRGIEQKIALLNENKLKYPDGKYSIEQILQALKGINVTEVDNGNGYQLTSTTQNSFLNFWNVVNSQN